MFNKNPQINQSAGVVSGKFTGDGALGGGLARSVASPAGYFKLEKQPVSNLPVSYQQRSLPAYVDKKSRSLVPVSAVLATLFAVSLIGVSPLIMSIISSSKVAFVSNVVEKDFLPEIDTKNLISNVQDATIVMPEKVANKFASASIFTAVGDFFGNLWVWCQSIFSTIMDNWKKFLGLAPDDKPASASSLTPELQAQLKKEITDELYGRLMAGEPALASFVGNRTGILISTSTGASSSDEALKQKIKDMFSDKVDISFDKSGNSGVITPQFSRTKNGSNYVFVLTPLR